MAQRILEKCVQTVTPAGDGTTDLVWTAMVEFVDTVQVDPATGQAPYVVEDTVQVRIPIATTLVADLENLRSTAYKNRCVQLFGSAPAAALLIAFKAA